MLQFIYIKIIMMYVICVKSASDILFINCIIQGRG